MFVDNYASLSSSQKKVLDKSCTDNQNTCFIFNKSFENVH